MGETPEQLRADIAQQRRDLAANVNAIEDRVSPSHIAERKKAEYRYRAGQSLSTVRNRVLGDPAAADPPARPPSRGTGADDEGALSGAAARVGDAAGHASEAVGQVPHQVVAHAQGAPLAAGLLALGAGLLIGALLPETKTEKRAVTHVQPQLEAAATHAAEVGRDSATHLEGPATDALTHLKGSAQEAVADLQDQATDAATHIAADAKP